MKNLFWHLLLTVLIFSCNDDNDGNGLRNITVDFKFTHTWDGAVINDSNFTTSVVTNANGETMTIARLRYLISRIELFNTQGDSFTFDGYKFTDLSDTTTYDFSTNNAIIPSGTYTLRFIWGFNEEDNLDGAYPDLNSASWNWPEMLGGGYHFLQLDGMYNVDSSPSPYNFHNGTARLSTNPNVFEQNFATIEFPEEIVLSENATIEIVMDIAEFFKNPNTWNLNVLDTPLMPNYNAQKMMQENVRTVFSLGTVSQ
ncbi:hypothetical protein BWZ20_08475 [Winogradskyella sp. J14-2]|uniref:MbnP family protein n=1 Tax=Winogradskyella sp. J14-2 TaxID=1936080 RepID=UPI000972A1B1|nr:MbnP family protein [Winogradskyella sp. J14-2]APY08330.1 hypothetical protein BWZ20_08475 [Winogradskyella sp. J14-2]